MISYCDPFTFNLTNFSAVFHDRLTAQHLLTVGHNFCVD